MKKTVLLGITLLLFASFAYSALQVVDYNNPTPNDYGGADTTWLAQCFNMSDNYTINRLTLLTGGYAGIGNIGIEIWNYDDSDEEPGAVLANNDASIDVTTISAGYYNVSWGSASDSLKKGCFVIRRDSGTAVLYVNRTGGESYAEGHAYYSTDSGVTWLDHTPRDYVFFLYTNVSGGPSFENPTPADGSIKNTNQIINVSCPAGDVSLWYDNGTTPTTKVIDEVASPADYTTSETISDTYYYIASCDNGVTNSSTRSLILDFEFPLIELNYNNSFNSQNISTTNNFNNSVPFSINVTDERDLSAFQILGYYANNSYFYNYTNLTLSGSNFTFDRFVDFSAVTPDRILYFNISASDSHTNNKIKDYSIIKIKDGLEFITAEGNHITLETDATQYIEFEKQKDRYNYTFQFDDKTKKDRVFKLKSKRGPIRYLPTSEYKGHFIIYSDGVAGNWLDFETDETSNFTIEKQNDHYFKITFHGLSDVSFNSIGGLNIERITYSWYYGDYSAWVDPEPALSEIQSTFFLNVSRGLDIVELNANLYYNSSYWAPDRVTRYSNYSIFEVDITEGVTADTTKYYLWNVTYNRSDTTTQSFNTTQYEHNVTAWFFDSCETANTTAFTAFIRNEKTNLPITANLTISAEYYITGSPTIIKDYQNNVYNNNTYTFCKTPPSVSFTGDITFIIEGAGLGTRTIFYNNVLYNDSFYLMALETSDNADYITFRIQDTGGDAIESAEMQIYRIVNATNTLIYQGSSDFAGQITTFLDQLYTYDFTINATGYPLKSFSLMPAQNTYTITLTGATAGYTSPYEGIRYKIEPDVNLINISDNFYNITFYAEGDTITEIGINFTNHNFECSPASCSATLAGPGSVTMGIKVNTTGTLNTAYYFIANGNKIFVNDGIIKGVVFGYVAQNSLIQLLERIKENTSPNTRTVLVALASIAGVGVGASIGIFGTFLLLPVAVVNIVASLPGIEFIHPLIGVFMAVFSIAIVVFVSMRDL